MHPDSIARLGPQWLIQGDCFDVLPRLPAGSVDMVFADLPYGVTRNRWDSTLPLAVLWRNLWRVTKPAGAVVLTATIVFAADLIASQRQHFRYDLIWSKWPMVTGFLNANRAPLRQHEHVLIFCQNIPPYAPQKTQGSSWAKGSGGGHGSNYGSGRHRGPQQNKTGMRYPVSVVTVSPCRREGRMHPTQKPVALLEWLIRTYCPEGGLVLDPTAGVATTAVAAHRTGRRSICIERDPGYHAAAVDRVRAAQAAPAAAAPLRPKRAPRPPPAAQRTLWAK